ncbi:hypothetical protein [Sphaerospermopsis aphanizomenoides]|nr:hypothetical protein [Sphaerospermopsis aphanizomenoides]
MAKSGQHQKPHLYLYQIQQLQISLQSNKISIAIAQLQESEFGKLFR